MNNFNSSPCFAPALEDDIRELRYAAAAWFRDDLVKALERVIARAEGGGQSPKGVTWEGVGWLDNGPTPR